MLLAASVLLQGTLNTVTAQHKHRTDKESHKIICYYSDSLNVGYFPPPEAYTSRLKSGQEAGAKFNFIIVNSPSSLLLPALQKAGEIWGSLIYSPVPITVKVVFSDLDEGVLGATSPAWPPYILDNNGYLGKRVYTQALAEKLLQRNLNGNEYDMLMEYSENLSWYFRTDGETPDDRYDFLSVVLHEMAHGLGFYGYHSVDEQGIGYGLSIPSVFDGFLENESGEKISDTLVFPNPSKKLGEALTSPPVIFKSPIITRELPGEEPGPNMFIPSTWKAGNSLYHLETRYQLVNHGVDALMTFSTGTGPSPHDPGPIATYMMFEMGWVHTYILHDTLKDRETINEPFTVSASIYGDMGIQDGSQKLFYSFNGFQSLDSVAMTGTGSEYSADIPVPSVGTTVNYYIMTLDTFSRVYSMPANAPSNSFGFEVGPDNSPPSITHTPIQFILTTYDTVEVKAGIWDNLGLDITQVEYKINDVDQTPVNLEFDTLSDYKGYFIFGPENVKADDIIKYRIKAVDGSVSKHTTYHPATGYHEFKVEDVPPFVDYYYNDLESGIEDFLVDRFYHSKPAGFSSYGLHTDHPYPSPNTDDGRDQVFAQLKVPVRLNPGMMQLSFDEIAYIEDGDPGSKWGDENFWDYVIIEGSKDGGNSWQPFILGYDCRYWSAWSNDFTDPNKQNPAAYLSTAVPDESQMRQHRVNLFSSSHFEEGDIVLIRFLLVIDPYQSGWGWVIDNIEIKPLVTGTGDISIVSDAIELFPNPTTGILTVNMQLMKEENALNISLLDMTGRQIFTESYASPGLSFSQYFELGDLPNGVYVMKFSSGNQSIMKKVILAR